VDALVWAITELMLSEQTTGMIDFAAHLAQGKKLEHVKPAPAD
jgi:hypothetical protein